MEKFNVESAAVKQLLALYCLFHKIKLTDETDDVFAFWYFLNNAIRKKNVSNLY